MEMLQKTINAYDEKCKREIENILKEYQAKAKNDIQYLKELKAKEISTDSIEQEKLGISCRLI